jgi:AAA+ superfamily predicted ATPase
MNDLPAWAQDMGDLFRTGSVSQFIIYGNIFDVVPARTNAGHRQLSLKAFLEEVMFASYDVVIEYDRSKGIRLIRGAEDYAKWLDQLAGPDEAQGLALVRESGKALELIDRYILRSLNLQSLNNGGTVPRKIAIIIDFAEFVVPNGQAIQLTGEFSANIVKILGWANDPAIQQSNIATVLLTEGLHDLNDLVVKNPHSSKLLIPLPNEQEMLEYIQLLAETQFTDLAQQCEVSLEVLAGRLVGLSRIGARTAIALTIKNGRKITTQWLMKIRKDMIEQECQGLLEFVESPFTLDNVAGLDSAKDWLRQDTALLKKGVLHALPMGYLICGRIGTGKTFIVTCWAGELGIPCAVLKNFRDRWIGATESNLEKIFAILHALGQVVVFVDEADQVAGKRDSGSEDGGLSGRVYGMLAKEMSDTTNRGKIVWVFATSRPDLLEVDLKRQGRLDVHIPLFGPQTPQEVQTLLLSVAKKLKFPVAQTDLPEMPENLLLGGNELEGILVRALRAWELQEGDKKPLKELLGDVFRDVRPNANSRKLEYMDLVAVKECTDGRFLPKHFQELTPEDLERRIDELRRFM